MAVVEVKQLVKEFDGGKVRAIDGVDLTTEEGEYLVLLGPSGCGKTTLLRTIAGLERPTTGSIYINGKEVTDLPPRLRRIAMVFQSYALYPHKTVHGNIGFPLRAAGMPAAERERKIHWAAGLLGIEHLLTRKPRQLSGGERQRVALARALVREPQVFLLDEPLSNLDAKLRAAARDELKRFQQEVLTTTIYVTHDQVEAMGLGDRIAVFSAGRIRQVGAPAEVYDDPADTFVATFIGSPPMNLIPRDGVLVGFRPEHLMPVPENGDGPGNGPGSGPDRVQLSLAVDRIEYLSGDRHVYGTAMGIGEPTRVVARLPATVTNPVPAGSSHDFTVARDKLRYFTMESGLRTGAVQW